MTARQPEPTGAKQSRPLQILVYTPQSGGAKGAPQTSEVFDVSGSGSKDGAGGSRTLEFTNSNGETLRIPEYTTHTVRSSPSSTTSGSAQGRYYRPITTTPAAPIYPHHNRQYPDHFLHLYLSHQEPFLPLPPPPPPPPHPTFIPPTPQQSPEFAMATMAIPPISGEEWAAVLASPEPPPEEMLGLEPGPPAVTEELLEACLPVDSTDEGRQWWNELLCAGDEQGFWTRFLGSDERVLGREAGWSGNGVREAQGGCGGA